MIGSQAVSFCLLCTRASIDTVRVTFNILIALREVGLVNSHKIKQLSPDGDTMHQ